MNSTPEQLDGLKELKKDYALIDRTPASTPQKLRICCLRPGIYAAKALLGGIECTFAITQLSEKAIHKNYWIWICSDGTHSTPVGTLREAKEQLWNYIKDKHHA